MINYRVQNIEGLVNKLKANGVTILDSIETFDYGKFVHIMDDEGNKIELWEPLTTYLLLWEEKRPNKIRTKAFLNNQELLSRSVNFRITKL